MRRFQLHRDHDVSGVSGTGVVAEGVAFTDGTVAMNWLGPRSSKVLHESVENVVGIHGHEGNTRLVWLDPAPVKRATFRNGSPESTRRLHPGGLTTEDDAGT